jgi:putative drug exporter of the RND superfamily
MPTLGLRFGFPDAGIQSDQRQMSRRAYDLTAEAFGPGANGPLVLTVRSPVTERLLPSLPPRRRAGHRLWPIRRLEPGVAAAYCPGRSPTGPAAPSCSASFPPPGPRTRLTEDRSSGASVARRCQPVAGPPGADVLVGGITALLVDEADYEGVGCRGSSLRCSCCRSCCCSWCSGRRWWR